MTQPGAVRGARTGLAGVLWAGGVPVRALLLGLLSLYRRLLSPMLGARCRFHPSCSAYAEEAIRVHGAAKGLVLAAWRVLRCSPLTPGGLDPIPPRGAWRLPGTPRGGPRPVLPYDGNIRSRPGRA